MRTLAIIPARSGSKRLPGKNIRPFLELPLLNWSIVFARELRSFDRIVVSTDAPEIAAVAESAGLPVPRLRPADLSTDTATSVDVMLDVIADEHAQGRDHDLVALLQPTSPVRRGERWRAAFALLQSEDVDAVIGVAPVRTHPCHAFHWSNPPRLDPFLDSDGLGLRSQDLPPAVAVVGNLYLMRVSVLEKLRTVYPPRTVGVLCDRPEEALDIDTEDDWMWAEFVARRVGCAP